MSVIRFLPVLFLPVLCFLLTTAYSSDQEQQSYQDASRPDLGPTADLVFTDAYVYTVDEHRRIQQAIAISGKEIIYVGDNVGVQAFIGDNTIVRDLSGRMIMPGLHDMHIHAAGIVEPDMCDFKGEAMSLEAMVPFLQNCIEHYQIPDGEWLVVLQWPFSRGNQPSDRLPSLRAALDAASEKHPIIMWGDDGHHAAVNSLALAMAKDREGNIVGISKETIANVFTDYREMIAVDEKGEPNGSLSEAARMLIREDFMADMMGLNVPPETVMPRVAERLAESGITSIQDPFVDAPLASYYAWLAEQELMNFRIRMAFFEPNSKSGDGLSRVTITFSPTE